MQVQLVILTLFPEVSAYGPSSNTLTCLLSLLLTSITAEAAATMSG